MPLLMGRFLTFKKKLIHCKASAKVVELVDTLDLGSSAFLA